MATPVPTGVTLEIVTYRGPSRDKKNLLFLGDGFASTDRALFDRTINEVMARFFRKAPFNLRGVRNEFNIFKAFTPSTNSGISCLLDVDASGITIDSDNVGVAGPAVGKLQDKASALGLTYGSSARVIKAKTGDENLIRDFINTLSIPFGYESLMDTAVPHCWAEPTNVVDIITGKDFGLVVVLINDDKFGGSYTPGAPYTPLSLGEENGFNLGALVSPGLYDHTPNSPRNNYNLIITGVHHELGHAHFNLGDEYSYSHDPNVATTPGYFSRANLVTKADVEDASNNLDPSLIKWRKPAFAGSSDNLIGTTAFNYMNTNHKPLWERPAGTICANVGYDGSTKYPPVSVRGSIRYPQRIIGLYEGGQEVCGAYSPAGSCRMRSRHYDSDYCFVCKHAIIEKINPIYLERLYNVFYPR